MTILGESKYERINNDAYWTPEWCTQVLLDNIKFNQCIWEPACGKGNISKILEENNYLVWSSDLNDYNFGDKNLNFFTVTDNKNWKYFRDIITNPPYNKAEEFVKHAIKLTQEDAGKVAMLLRNEWDSASSRTYLFTNKLFYAKLVLTKRPNWTEDRKASPRHNFSWFIWDWKYEGEPKILYQKT